MIKNFVDDPDLKAQRTNIASYLPAGQTSYAGKIALAFEMVLNDFRSREIDPRKLHIPIDLNRAHDSKDVHNILISLTETSSGNGSDYVEGITGFRRFVVNFIAASGITGTFTLQGSNDTLIVSTDLPVNWTAIQMISFQATGSKSVVFDDEYKYYRLSWAVAGTDPSIQFTSGLYETCFDQLIIQKTFFLIYQEMSKTTDDIWYDNMVRADLAYESVMRSIKFIIDKNDNNVPEQATEKRNNNVSFSL